MSETKEALLSGVAGLALVSLLASQTVTDSEVVRLFGRWDVAACGVLSAMPLGIWLGRHSRQYGRALAFSVSLLFAFAAVILYVTAELAFAAGMSAGPRWLWSCLVAAAATLGITGGLTSLTNPSRAERFQAQAGETPEMANHWLFGAVLSIAALLLPIAYQDSLAEGWAKDLRTGLEEQRVPFALHRAAQLRQLDPERELSGQTVDQWWHGLRQRHQNLQHQVARPLPAAADTAATAARITALMQLERYRQALKHLRPLTCDPAVRPLALDYQGLCYQRLDQPAASLAAYQAAADHWRAQSPGVPRYREALASALRGIGYACRELHRHADQQRAYEELLELAPTGEHHLLLARCYSQQGAAALTAKHVAAAKAADPRLAAAADKLLVSLRRDHFGCLSGLGEGS